MDKKGFNRRDYFKTTGAVAGLGIMGTMLGTPGDASGQVMQKVMQRMGGLPPDRELDPSGGLSVVLIGTGSPLPNPDRACASTMVIAGDRAICVDTGRGAWLRMAQAGLMNPHMLLYTHFHSDHIADFGEVMMNRFAIAGADTPMPIVGPPGVKKMVNGILDSFSMDKQYRIEHHGRAVSEKGYETEVTESQPGVILDDNGLKITMFEVDHWPVTPAVGYKFEYKGKSVVVSGDTKKVPIMTELSQGCDVLVHDTMNRNMVEMAARNSDVRRAKMATDILDYHTMTDEVAEIARDAGVKKLVLTHMVPSPMNHVMEAMFVRGMRKTYKGPMKVGSDLMEIKA